MSYEAATLLSLTGDLIKLLAETMHHALTEACWWKWHCVRADFPGPKIGIPVVGNTIPRQLELTRDQYVRWGLWLWFYPFTNRSTRLGWSPGTRRWTLWTWFG